MDVGDINGDGKTNLVLSNFALTPSFIKSNFEWKMGPPFVNLKNSIKPSKLQINPEINNKLSNTPHPI